MYISNAQLTLAEKTTVLMSTIAIAFMVLLLSVVALLFIVIGIANWLESYIEPFWTFFIVAGVFLLMMAVLVIFRVKLVYNPIARFISKLFVNPPKE